jgi:hypothetical protein
MGKSTRAAKRPPGESTAAPKPGKPSALLDTRVIYCGDNLGTEKVTSRISAAKNTECPDLLPWTYKRIA